MVGDRVLLLPKEYSLERIDDYEIKKGTIIKEYKGDEDFSYHGSPWFSDVTEVQLEDNTIYKHDSIANDLYSIRTVKSLLTQITRKKSEFRSRILNLDDSEDFLLVLQEEWL